jgi:hypothetical protein
MKSLTVPSPGNLPAVENLPKNETMRRRRHSGKPPVLGFQHRLKVVWSEPPEPYLDKGACDAATHSIKKTVAFNNEGQQRPFCLDTAP